MSEVQDQNLNSDHLDLKHLDKKTEELLVKKAGEAKEYSYSPYSGFRSERHSLQRVAGSIPAVI